MQFITRTKYQGKLQKNGKQLEEMLTHTKGMTVGCSFCFGWELQFCTGYPGFGVPVPLFIGYLISYSKFTRTTYHISMWIIEDPGI